MFAKTLAGAAALLGLSLLGINLATPGEQPLSDLVVTVKPAGGGAVDVYKDEVVRLELILDSAGKLDQVHLVTKSGTEADTHIWYNVDNLVSVQYQFLAITGKGKVVVRGLEPPRVKESPQTRAKLLAPIDPDDYK